LWANDKELPLDKAMLIYLKVEITDKKKLARAALNLDAFLKDQELALLPVVFDIPKTERGVDALRNMANAMLLRAEQFEEKLNGSKIK